MCTLIRGCFVAAAAALVVASALAGESGEGEHWPQWRGPDGTGMARGSAPVRWSDTENLAWKRSIPGRGCSTPVVWGEQVFLTTAIALGETPEAPAENRSFHGGGGPQAEHSFDVLCLDRGTGEILWQDTAIVATPHEGFHRTYGSHASNSPVTDGEHLYAFFGSRGLYCYDLDGELIWEKDFGVQMETRNQFGEGVAPLLHEDMLVLLFDQERDSFIVAVDRTSGEELWRKERDEPTSWAQPIVVEHEGSKQIVVAATNRVRSYDPENGDLVWECGGLGVNAIPNPVQFEDTVIAMTGYREARLLAIRLGRTGDLTDTDAVVWSATRGLSYTPSPVLHEGTYYALTDRGQLSCFDAASGEPLYLEHRLSRGSSFKASPVGVDGRLYLAGESGEVFVVKMGKEPEEIATNTLEGAFFVASPVVVDGDLLLRSLEHLYCIRQEESK